MALAEAVQGQRHTGQRITWQDKLENKKDLTNATITGRIRNKTTEVERAIDGTLTPDADQTNNPGEFTWSYGANDTGEAGWFTVQFIATYSSDSLPDKSIPASWRVHEAI